MSGRRHHILRLILQLVGLRRLHSSISVAQIGAIVLMSAFKTELRMRRLEKEDNLFTNYPDEVIGHKLN